MKTTTLVTAMLAICALGTTACNIGPEPGDELDQREDAITYQVDPPECYGLRHFYRWTCQDGDWVLKKVGQRDIWCDGTVFVVGDETDCYADFATYDCETHTSCGEYDFVCASQPRHFCRPSIRVFDPPSQLAPW